MPKIAIKVEDTPAAQMPLITIKVLSTSSNKIPHDSQNQSTNPDGPLIPPSIGFNLDDILQDIDNSNTIATKPAASAIVNLATSKTTQSSYLKESFYSHKDSFQTQGNRQAIDPIFHPIVSSDSYRLKKMKSTLPDIGKMKSELQEENERLRHGKSSPFVEQIQED